MRCCFMQFRSYLWMLLLISCVQMRVSDEEMHKDFKSYDYIPSSATLLVDSSHLHYVYTENKRANLVVFIHGSPGNWSNFQGFFKNDSLQENWDMVAIDRPGYGYSDYGRPVVSLAEQAYHIKQVVDQFDHSNVILVGHSLGAPIAAKMAIDYPNVVDGIILVGPSIDPDLEKKEWYRSIIQTRVGGAITPTAFWVSNEEILSLKSQLNDMMDEWKSINQPVIVIQGTRDMLVPKENADFARKMLPDTIVDIRMLEGVNHFIPWTNPEAIVEALEDLAF